jgi:hypothetical protein
VEAQYTYSASVQMKNYTHIPDIFCSSETGYPIAHCMICDQYLLDDGKQYFIEKAVRQYPEMSAREIIFEYALCVDCALKMNASLSEESRRRTNEYLSRHARLSMRKNIFLSEEPPDLNAWIDHCRIKDTPISGSREYQLLAHCNGRNLMLGEMPFALSLEAMDELAQLLSAKSLGEIDDFIGKYFSGPPELASLLRKRPPVLI